MRQLTKYEVAANSSTSPEVLTRLAENKTITLLCVAAVASNPSTPTETLAKLSENEYRPVRRAAALNPSTTTIALTKLAEDEDVSIRCYVASNLSTSPEVLMKLVKDKNEEVKNRAKQNPIYLQYCAEQDGVRGKSVKLPVEWLKEIYLA